jgi:hypothetical protein
MDDNNLFFDITPNGEEKHFLLRNACSLEVETEVGPIKLVVDKDQPMFLFIEIEGEMRRCYDLRNYDLNFLSNKEVLAFLQKVRESEFFARIVDDEQDLNEEWADL